MKVYFIGVLTFDQLLLKANGGGYSQVLLFIAKPEIYELPHFSIEAIFEANQAEGELLHPIVDEKVLRAILNHMCDIEDGNYVRNQAKCYSIAS